MNLVGKIFVVLIFVMSLVLMSLTISVYMTHQNWRFVVENMDSTKGPLGLKKQLQDSQEENERLREIHGKLEQDAKKEKDEKDNAVSKLRTELEEQKKEVANYQEQVNDLSSKLSTSLTATESAEKHVNLLTEQIDTLSAQLQKTILLRDQTVKESENLTVKLNELANQQRLLKRRNEQMTADLVRANSVLAHHSLIPDPDYYRNVAPPVGIEGLIKGVNKDHKLVIISVGSDDGLRKGHILEVQRPNGPYVGRIQVDKVEADQALCKILSDYNQSVTFQAGDRVVDKVK